MLGWLGLLCCLAYLFGHLWVRLRCLEVRSVDDFEPPACDPAKRLSVVVAARNEEDTIVPALQRLLSHSDPQREIIIVEDRSEDRTRELVAKLCAEHSELRMVVIEAPSSRPDSRIDIPVSCPESIKYSKYRMFLNGFAFKIFEKPKV